MTLTRWNESEMYEETKCPFCLHWHKRFDHYPHLALCPYRKDGKHRRRFIRFVDMPHKTTAHVP